MTKFQTFFVTFARDSYYISSSLLLQVTYVILTKIDLIYDKTGKKMMSFGEHIFCSSVFARTFMKAQLYVMKFPMKYHPPIVAFTQLCDKVFSPGYKWKKLSQQTLMHFQFSYYLLMSTKRKISGGVSIEYKFFWRASPLNWYILVFFT